MYFNNNIFIFIFLPAIVLIYYLIPLLFKFKTEINKIYLIIISSLLFASINLMNIIYLLIIFLLNYLITQYLLKVKNIKISKFILFAGILLNVVLWLLIKNIAPLTEIYNFIFNSYYKIPVWLVPLGFGFIILQQIIYIVECYKQKYQHINLVDYLAFSTFFPKLIAGPLTSFSNFNKQFDTLTYKINFLNISKAIYIIFYSLFIKILFADTFATIANNGFNANSLNFFQAWVVSLCNILRIFFDISAYTGIAIGIALLFNIRLSDNFSYPFKATNIKEFWNRWHLTFSDFFTKAIANSIVKKRKNILIISTASFISFLLMGIWHNMNVKFVLWGFVNALAIIICILFEKMRIKLPRFISIILLFFFLNFMWLLFSVGNMSQFLIVASGMLSVKSIFLYYNEFYILWVIDANFIIIIMLAISYLIAVKNNFNNIIDNFKPSLTKLSILIFFILFILLFNTEKSFIYYGF